MQSSGCMTVGLTIKQLREFGISVRAKLTEQWDTVLKC